jgi:hypothetical protein
MVNSITANDELRPVYVNMQYKQASEWFCPDTKLAKRLHWTLSRGAAAAFSASDKQPVMRIHPEMGF